MMFSKYTNGGGGVLKKTLSVKVTIKPQESTALKLFQSGSPKPPRVI